MIPDDREFRIERCAVTDMDKALKDVDVEELKALIDEAHRNGVAVIMDIVSYGVLGVLIH